MSKLGIFDILIDHFACNTKLFLQTKPLMSELEVRNICC